MPPPLDREMLRSLKRADLQRICKDYGIKANLKTEALIELLVDTTQAARPAPAPPPQRAPSTRIASRTTANSRLRGSSTSSVIIHDTDEEDNAVTDDPFTSGLSAPPSEASTAPAPPPRRRAKETQYKLGVGRPTAAGGHGARAVTRTASLSQKGKRGKGSKSVKPTEAAIAEEEEPDPTQSEMPEAGPSGTNHEPPPAEPPAAPLPVPPLPVSHPPEQNTDPLELALLPVSVPDTSEQLKTYVNNLVAPLQTQVQLLQAEMQQRSNLAADLNMLAAQVRSLQTEVDSLRSQAALLPQLQAEILQLRQFVALLTQASTGMVSAPSEKSLGKARASDEGSSGTTVGGVEASHMTPAMAQAAFPGSSQSTLGKRHRDLNDSDVIDMVEAGQEDTYGQEDLERRVVRPTKKRPKLSNQESAVMSEPRSGEAVGEAPPNTDAEGEAAAPHAFTIFQGPEEPPESYIDPPPPTTHLSDLFPFDPDSGQITPPNQGGAIPRAPGADENAPNQLPHNYNFSFNTSLFHPVTSTPFGMDLPPFTYPEPPASPSPAAPSGGFVERAGGRIERNDLFQPLRRPSQAPAQAHTPSRPRSAASRPPSRGATAGSSQRGSAATINPSALLATPGLSVVPEVAEEGPSIPSVAMPNGLSIFGLPRRTVSSTEVGIQLGMSSTLPLPPETPGRPAQRTMYGTELDSDTRFGDFGVEGVASGFWAGLARRT